MSLLGLKYIRKQRLLILVLMLTMASALFSVTAFSFLGFYQTFNSYLGEEADVIAIHDRRSSTPFTGLVPMYIATRIQSMEGVLASSPEVVAPATMNEASIFLRGIIPNHFTQLTKITMIHGNPLKLEDTNFAIAGTRLAERLNLKVGNKILVFSILTERYLELEIKGVFESKTPVDDEILVPIYVGQWLRGADYAYATIIRFKIDRSKLSTESLWGAIAEEVKPPGPGTEKPPQPGQAAGIMPIPRVGFKPGDIGVEEAQVFMASYLNRYGVTANTLLILSIIVFALASASTFTASQTLIQQHLPEIGVLRSVGMSKKSLKIDLTAKILPYSLTASLTGMAIAVAALLAIDRISHMRALSHTISLQPSPIIMVLNIALTLLTTAISIARSTVR